MTPEEILSSIKDLPLKEVVKFLGAKGIFDLSKKGYESLKEFIKRKSSEKKYGFVPKADEGNVLVKVAEKQYFVNFAYVLPKHRYSDLIRVGYLISYLNKIGGSANRQRVEIIRESIRNIPNGHFLIKIVNLVSLIMIFSYGSAKNNTTLAIAELLKEGVTKNYHYESNNNIEGEKEVHSSTFTLMEL